MIVDDLNFHRAAIGPSKTNAPLIVDADAVLAFPVAFKGFEPVGRGKPKVGQGSRRKHALKPHPRSALDGCRQAVNKPSFKDMLGVFVFESIHDRILTHCVNNAKG